MVSRGYDGLLDAIMLAQRLADVSVDSLIVFPASPDNSAQPTGSPS
ncbi:MAG: hypothetical protein KF752_05215 [Pirellulaceae bacterium]|nr:hypothetical protein [Pirellulaceae bacterium]